MSDLATPSPLRADQPMTAQKVRELWERGVKSTRNERETAAVNAMFMRNRQWVYWNRGSGRLEELPREPSRVRASVPRIGPDSRRIIAKLMRRGLTFDVPPSSPDDAAMRAARIGEAALADAHRAQSWEELRLDHAYVTWQAGVGGLCVEWDWRVGAPVAVDDKGQTVGTGDVKLSVVSLHEIACEPGTRDLEKAYWWVRGVALPPPEVQTMYSLKTEPKSDARALDQVWRMTDTESATSTPMTMVLTLWERPHDTTPGRVVTVVDNQIVDEGEWPFPFEDRLNIAVARVEPIHGRWFGHTPVTDAVGIQALYNMSWSSIVEHMKLAGNARLWVPMGALDDVDELTDTPGEAIEYNAINGTKPEYEAPPVMPDWWIRQPEMLANALDDVLGVHGVSRGESPAGIESGVALSILSEADDTPVGALAKVLGECWARTASMVLKVWEANVAETRESTVHLPGNVPEAIRWSGQSLAGQTTAVVPLDQVMPRSRAAQAAYALQLYDRKIISTPSELTRVADLPDQDDLLAGIDPDTARAQRENYWMAIGTPRTVDVIDDHSNHLKVHRDFMRSERFEYLPPESQGIIRDHNKAHEMYAAGQAAEQTQAAGVSPLAAMLPTEATRVLPTDDLQQAKDVSQMTPSAGMENAPPAPTELPPEIAAELAGMQQQGGAPPQEAPPEGELPL